MLKFPKRLDLFSRNILLVFSVTSIANFVNLLYQVFVAHAFTPSDFAGFNAIISVISIFSAPWGTVQFAVAKYCAEFNARKEYRQITSLIIDLLKKLLLIAAGVILLYVIFSVVFLHLLKLPSAASASVLAFMCVPIVVMPVLAGGVQGLEIFRWLAWGGLAGTLIKLLASLLFIYWGFGITGALGGLLIANAATVFIYSLALKRRLVPERQVIPPVSYLDFIGYLLPVAVTNLCFMLLVNSDMILVRSWFSPEDSGSYALGQMVGKIFLFLPGAISVVLFPRAAGQKASRQDTRSELKRSLLYTFALCLLALIVYNAFPGLMLRALTGKVHPESIALGRLFSVSMTLYTLGYILTTYFLSINDFRFIQFLFLFTGLQLGGFLLFRDSTWQIQIVMCGVALLLLGTYLVLAFLPRRFKFRKRKINTVQP